MGAERVRRWIEAREPRPPSELASRLREDLDAPGTPDEAGSLAELLARAALRRLRRARDRGEARSGAFELLAADAYVTYACEAVVDPDGAEGEARGDASRVEGGFLALLRRVSADAV